MVQPQYDEGTHEAQSSCWPFAKSLTVRLTGAQRARIQTDTGVIYKAVPIYPAHVDATGVTLDDTSNGRGDIKRDVQSLGKVVECTSGNDAKLAVCPANDLGYGINSAVAACSDDSRTLFGADLGKLLPKTMVGDGYVVRLNMVDGKGLLYVVEPIAAARAGIVDYDDVAHYGFTAMTINATATAPSNHPAMTSVGKCAPR